MRLFSGKIDGRREETCAKCGNEYAICYWQVMDSDGYCPDCASERDTKAAAEEEVAEEAG